MVKLPNALLKFFFHFIRKQPFAFIVFFLTPISIILETNIIPYAIKILIDNIVSYEGNKSSIVEVIAPTLWLGGISWIGLIVIFRLQHWWQAYIIPLFEADIRQSILSYIMLHSYSFFSDQLSGNISNKVSDITKSIESIRMIICWNIIPAFAVILVTLIMTATIDLVFFCIVGLWVIIQLSINFYFVRTVQKTARENAEDKSILSGAIVDIISNIVSIKLFARRPYELQYFNKRQTKEKASHSRLIITTNLFHLSMDIPVTIMFGSIFYFLILYWQQDKISAGDFVFIFSIMFAVMNQMWNLGHALSNLFCEIGIVQQALTLIACPLQVIDKLNARHLKVHRGEIEFINVTFSYDKNKVIFKHKNILIKPGQKVGLVGFSGSGKSTFIKLILRFYDIDSGIITIDGNDITKVTQDSLRTNIAVIPQDIILFHRTLMENIRYGRVNATDEEVIKASKNAHCHDFIIQLLEGYNTLDGERGIKLSGGQRQQIAIARAMLKEAPIIILDEATSALDTESEKVC